MSKCKFVPLKHSELHHIYHLLGEGKKASKIKAKLKIAMNTTCIKTEKALNQHNNKP
ncbi:hypothetical protein VPHD85_0076 [Vibrio phage D85]|nr:hypothetical protein PODOV033v1_p0054 [Vibrio phage 252E42.2]